MMGPLEGNPSMPPVPEGGHHSKHGAGGAHDSHKTVPQQNERADHPVVKQNPEQISHSVTAKKPANASSKKKFQKKDREEKDKENQDVLEDSKEQKEDTFDVEDYGGSPFGGSNRVSPEKNDFW
jgi:hypothetical protein